MAQCEIHELLALVYYDSLQSVVPFYDQRTVVPLKDAAWVVFCENSMRHFKKAFAHKYVLFSAVLFCANTYTNLMSQIQMGLFVLSSVSGKTGPMLTILGNSAKSLGTLMRHHYHIMIKLLL